MSYPPRVLLREVVDSELPIFFEHQRDPEAVRLAAFSSRDDDAFMTHWAKLRREPSNIIRTIVCDGQVAGNIGSWIAEDKRLIGYWIGRDFWGRGVATAALAAFVAEVKERPLHAFVAKHNVGSIRVLEKCEFVPSPSTIPASPPKTGSMRSSTCSRAEEFDPQVQDRRRSTLTGYASSIELILITYTMAAEIDDKLPPDSS
jgi:RimJ/RimL family protein N-acetyltransferase